MFCKKGVLRNFAKFTGKFTKFSPVSVIFDKSHKGYKGKDAWDKIANSLDFIPDGMYYILATI